MSGGSAEPGSGSPLRGLVTGGLTAALTWAAGRLAVGLNPVLAVLAAPAVAAGSYACHMMHQRYAAILARQTPHARRDYDALRQNLPTDGLAARTYARWLTAALAAVDRFFGDAGAADRSLWPRAFGLRAPAPLWTPAAFDRCLLLALLYPVATILIFWAISGHAGPAEHAPGLPEHVNGWRRTGALGPLAFSGFAAWRFQKARGRSSLLWLIIAVFRVVAGAVLYLNDRSQRNGWQGLFQVAFLLVFGLACLVAAGMLASRAEWRITGPLLPFFGLLTLLNAPFDWASPGLTRALLRRGLEIGGWAPCFLALLDAVIAGFIIVFLTVVTVVGVQAFDTVAALSGGDGARILPLIPLFDGIEADLWAAEYRWVYALLLSTLLPSMANLVIGGASLLRGLAWLRRLLLRFMPAVGAPAAYDRRWMAALLTAQIFIGWMLGAGAQVVLAYAVIGVALPLVGWDLFDLARGVAAADLPGHAMGRFGWRMPG